MSEYVKHKVDFSVFVWVISILSGIMMLISGYLFTELSDIRANIASTNSLIQMSREQSQVLRESIIEIKADLKYIKEKVDSNRGIK